MWGLVSKLLKREISWHPWIRGTLKQSWVYSGVAHILFRVYSGVEYRHVYSTQLSRIYECILNTLYWVDTHTLYSAELNASALLYSAELSRTECLSMSILSKSPNLVPLTTVSDAPPILALSLLLYTYSYCCALTGNHLVPRSHCDTLYRYCCDKRQ